MNEEHMEEDTVETESIETTPMENAEAIESASEKAAAQLPPEKLRSIIEVLLLVSDRPLSIKKIKEIIEGADSKAIQDAITRMRERLNENEFPYQVREIGGGFVLSSLPEYAPWVRKLYSPKAKTSRLSQAALETLAVIAYKQPVTRAEIEAIRGVNVDSTLKTLLDKRLCEIVGYKDVIGKPATYGTTNEFLLHFGLNNLKDLPSIEELRGSEAES
jgi:segregation and condensation protein B